MFPGMEISLEGVSVPSGVADQPATDGETLAGAWNRAHAVQGLRPEAAYWAGVEGGVEDGPHGMAAFAWVVVLSNELSGKSRTGTFFLPPLVAELVRQGKELGEADDIVFGRVNSKQENGAVGLLTGDVLDRAGFYRQAVLLALIPFKNRALYTHNSKES